MALPTLLAAPSIRAIWAVNFMDTAKPALSSAGEVIFEPEDSRARDLLSSVEDWRSSWALLSADKFVLITITLSVSRPTEGPFILRGVLAADAPFHGRSTISRPALIGG